MLASAMRRLLTKAFKNAVTQFKAEEALTPLGRWNEFVFRFYYSKALTALDADFEQWFEVNRIDLVVRRKNDLAFIEFKFYLHSARYYWLQGVSKGMKSYPSLKNLMEFEKSVDTLRRQPDSSAVPKFVALFYADPKDSPKNKRYEHYYGHDSGIEERLKLRRPISIGPFPTTDSKTDCYAKMYELTSQRSE
jgi:hypothetical protein